MTRPTNNPDPRVAGSVRAEMARAGKNQQALAAHLHLSQPAVSRRLSGSVSWSIDELVSTAEFLGVDVTVFVPQGVVEAVA
ncbi:helix-turn-helix domain-containing protein [Microbacterium sp.]|uniref:helix-turn-helix domain-containing protein n=1 Tax=Microbacterium sp. TaxID=51671 RepID=UPI0039E62CE5